MVFFLSKCWVWCTGHILRCNNPNFSQRSCLLSRPLYVFTVCPKTLLRGRCILLALSFPVLSDDARRCSNAFLELNTSLRGLQEGLYHVCMHMFHMALCVFARWTRVPWPTRYGTWRPTPVKTVSERRAFFPRWLGVSGLTLCLSPR